VAQVVDFQHCLGYFHLVFEPAKSNQWLFFRTLEARSKVCSASGAIFSIRPDLHVQNFPGLAMDGNFHGTTTDFAIHREFLRGLGDVHRQRESLSTKWTLNCFRFLHLPGQPKADIIGRSDWSEIEAMSTKWNKADGTRRAAIFCR
jgi:hypothetical protein